MSHEDIMRACEESKKRYDETGDAPYRFYADLPIKVPVKISESPVFCITLNGDGSIAKQ